MIDLDMLRDLIKCRDDLLFWLTDDGKPPKKYADPLWQAHNQLTEAVDDMKKVAGYDEFSEGGWTIFAPDKRPDEDKVS